MHGRKGLTGYVCDSVMEIVVMRSDNSTLLKL